MATKNNLIVNYIPSQVAEQELQRMFTPYGKVLECKIIRDRGTGGSLGYGFVKMETDEAAAAVIQALNGFKWEDKTLKLSYARPENEIDGTPRSVYLANLPPAYTREDVADLCARYGQVDDCRLFTNDDGTSRGVAVVRMENGDAALKIIAELNEYSIEGSDKRLVAKAWESKSRRDRKPDGPPQPTGYAPVRGAPSYTPPTYSPYAPPPAAPAPAPVAYPYAPPPSSYAPPPGAYPPAPPPGSYPPPPPQGYSPYGAPPSAGVYAPYGPPPPAAYPDPYYGYPQYDQYGGAAAAAPPVKGTNPAARRPGPPPPEDAPEAQLFVFHIPNDFTDESLKNLFQPFGSLVSAAVGVNKQTQENRGFGFVTFKLKRDAENAIQGLNGHQVGSKYLKVQWKQKKN